MRLWLSKNSTRLLTQVRFISACLTILMLVTSADARPRTPQERAAKIQLGSLVLVQMKTGQGVKGRLREVTSTELTLDPLAPQNAPRQTLLFDNVRSIELPKTQSFPRSLELLAAVPLIAICRVARIFNRNACDDL